MPGRILGMRRPSPASRTRKVLNPKDSGVSLVPSYQGSSPERSSMDSIRHSLGSRTSSDKKSSKADPVRAAKLSMDVESPPILFHDNTERSTGAIFSGQIKLDVTQPQVTLKSFQAQIFCTTSTKRPVVGSCPDCVTQSEELKKWEFNTEPLTLSKGMHTFPVSYLFPGHLPASTFGSLFAIDYRLAAEAVTSTGEIITLGQRIEVKRALFPAPEPRTSVRVFPPTNLTAQATLEPIVHPIGDINVSARIQGTVTKHDDHKVFWKLRRLTWRIEEKSKVVSPTCPKHAHKLGGEGNGMLHEDTRTIGEGEMKDGWKTDSASGNVDMEFSAAMNASLKPVCDIKAQNGMEVSHCLVLEMVVTEEYSPNRRPSQTVPTGAARVLRTQFTLVVTERAGLGVSWDEESPPMYQDVPDSPPIYAAMEDFDIRSFEDLALS